MNDSEEFIIFSTLVSSSPMLADMAIFTDRGYIYIALLGAGLSVLGTAHQVAKVFKKNRNKIFHPIYFISELVRAFIIGFLVAPFLFILFIHMGGKAIEFITGFNGANGLIDSFWFILTMICSWFAPLIWNGALNLIRYKINKILGK